MAATFTEELETRSSATVLLRTGSCGGVGASLIAIVRPLFPGGGIGSDFRSDVRSPRPSPSPWYFSEPGVKLTRAGGLASNSP